MGESSEEAQYARSRGHRPTRITAQRLHSAKLLYKALKVMKARNNSAVSSKISFSSLDMVTISQEDCSQICLNSRFTDVLSPIQGTNVSSRTYTVSTIRGYSFALMDVYPKAHSVGQRGSFHQWFSQVDHIFDFRIALNVNIGFIWSQMVGRLDKKDLARHALWADCMLQGWIAVEVQDSEFQATVVTKHVFGYFQGTYSNDQLLNTAFSMVAKRERYRRMERLGFAGDAVARSFTRKSVAADRAPKVGELVSFGRSRMRSAGSQSSYGLVQAIVPSQSQTGEKRLYILHVYPAKNTIIGDAPYAVSNELFLTDRCTCNGDDLKFYLSEVS